MSANLLATGRRFHQSGDLARAEQVYRQLLQREPRNAQGWYLLGALSESRGDLPAAAASLDQALRLQPIFADAIHHRGIVFSRQGRMNEATAKFREGARLRPGDVDIQLDLGLTLAHQGHYAEAIALFRVVLKRQPAHARAQTSLCEAMAKQAAGANASGARTDAARTRAGAAQAKHDALRFLQQGKLDEAVARLRKALSLRPDCSETYYHLGRTRAAQNFFDEAIACYGQALRLRADFAEAHNSLGLAFWAQKRPAEAEGSYRAAIRLRPNLAAAHANLGMALLQQKRLADAEVSCRETVRLLPASAEAHTLLGITLQEQGQLTGAVTSLRRAAQLDPSKAGVHNNLGGALWRLGRLEDAAVSLREALRLQPQFAEALNNQGNVLRDLGRFDEALASFAQAVRANPLGVDPQWNMALLWLLLGDLEKGWAQFECRWQFPSFPYSPPRAFAQPRWDGSLLAGRTILLHTEQGLGDSIQFIRFARLLKEQGARVVVESDRPLLRLFTSCPGIDQLVAQGDPLPAHDFRSPLMSLPYLLGTRLGTIPAHVPYRSADPGLVAQWRDELATPRGFKIGIAWQGNPQNPLDRKRSVPLAEFTPLAAVPGVRLVSLQKGPAREELPTVVPHWPMIDFSARLDEPTGPFMDTAAVMKNLDLVVTVDSSIAHLAAALGVPVWVALPKVPHWCWFLDREDTPWYPTMRLFRQERPGEWGSIFQRIAEAVQQRPRAIGA
jgi:tetratricopeptide (TPR) repeat protein